MLAKFTSIYKNENETVSEFNNWFTKLHTRIPQPVCPSDEIALVYHINAFDDTFNFLLRERT